MARNILRKRQQAHHASPRFFSRTAALVPRLAPLCLIAALASGCTQRLAIETPAVRADLSEALDESRIAGFDRVAVRSFEIGAKSAREFAGADCVLSSEELHARVTTPGYVIVPKFVQSRRFPERGRPAHLRVACRGSAGFGINSYTAEDKEIKTLTNGGLATAAVTTIFTAALAATTPWSFAEELNVPVMRDEPQFSVSMSPSTTTAQAQTPAMGFLPFTVEPQPATH